MRKKVVLIGLGLIILAGILFVVSGYVLTNGLGGGIVVNNFTVGSGNYSYAALKYDNATAVAVYAALGSSANLYALNGSAFARWTSYMESNSGSSGISYIYSLGVNSSYIKRNISVGVLPIDLKTGPFMLKNNPSAQIYVVVDNTQNSQSENSIVNVTVSYLPLQSGKLLESAALGYGVILLFIAGIIVIVYGFWKKKEDMPGPVQTPGKGTAKESKDREYVEQLYKGVKSKKRAKASKESEDKSK